MKRRRLLLGDVLVDDFEQQLLRHVGGMGWRRRSPPRTRMAIARVVLFEPDAIAIAIEDGDGEVDDLRHLVAVVRPVIADPQMVVSLNLESRLEQSDHEGEHVCPPAVPVIISNLMR